MSQHSFSFLEGSKVLVTGGAGFIGSHLCERLLELGAQVRCLDNLATGFARNLSNFKEHPHFEFLEGDIRSLDTCLEAVKDIDFVLHQAALGSVPRSLKDPMLTHEVNTTGFLNMLWAAKSVDVQRFVYAASSSTYGDSKELPKQEDRIGRPLSPYAITKYTNELYAQVFHDHYGIDTIGLRYFNVFGERQDPDGAYAAVIPKFVKAFLHGESPIIHGDGSYSRDFTYVKNVVQANLLALCTTKKEALNTVYNVACGNQCTIQDLASHIRTILTTSDPKIQDISMKFGPKRAGDVPHSLASITRAEELLDYQCAVPLQSGLKKAMPWYIQHLKNKTNV
ncbi:SDR family oxidoreductase [Croceiramulus getboli]|nr:SDR family oxidoreductase [Flavobacteriaceae bacterium YJPT1-3]